MGLFKLNSMNNPELSPYPKEFNSVEIVEFRLVSSFTTKVKTTRVLKQSM